GVARVAGDVDGDGRIDLVQGGVWRNLGGASFLPLVASWGSARALAGDVDGDGDCDLVVLPAGAPPILLLQQGASFIDASALIDERATLVGSKPQARLLDVDGDGATDLVIVGALASGAASLHLWAGGRWQVHVDGVLAAAQPATALGALDVDGDGRIDLLLGRSGGAYLRLGRIDAVSARAPARPGRAGRPGHDRRLGCAGGRSRRRRGARSGDRSADGVLALASGRRRTRGRVEPGRRVRAARAQRGRAGRCQRRRLARPV